MHELFQAFGINWKLLVIQIVNFGILLAVLYRFLYTPILRLIEERRSAIAKGIEDAERAGKELTAADEKKTKIVTEALLEKERIIKEARVEGASQEKNIIDSANERSARMLAEAKKAAAEEKERLLRESKQEIAALIVLSAKKIIEGREKA